MKTRTIVGRWLLPFLTIVSLASCGGNPFGSLQGEDDYCDERWETCEVFFEDKVAMGQAGSWGYVDAEGNQVIDFEFDGAAAFSHGVAIVMQDDAYNLIDGNGDVLLEEGYDFIGRDVDDSIMIYATLAGYGLLAENGSIVTDDIFTDFDGQFVEGLLAVSTGTGEYGYIDKTGDAKIPLTFQESYQFSAGLGLVKANGLYGYVDIDGDYVIDPTFTDAWSFDKSERAIVMNADETYSLINKSGDVLINSVADIWGEGPLYEVEDANGDLFLYKADGTKFKTQIYTYTNVYFDYLVNVEWDVGEDSFDQRILFNPDCTVSESLDYYDSDYIVSTDDKAYLIDTTSNLVLHSYEYDIFVMGTEVMMVTDSLIIVKDGTDIGAYTLEETPTTAIPFEYLNLMPMADDYLFAETDEGIGVINLDGDTIIPFEYDSFNFMPNIGD